MDTFVKDNIKRAGPYGAGRMLMDMKARTEAMRALAYCTAASMDRAQRHPDPAERARNHSRVELLTPVVKG